MFRRMGTWTNWFLVMALIGLTGVLVLGRDFQAAMASFSLQPINNLGGDRPIVSITCNVYSGGEYLDSMLETLREKNVRATFFVGGIWVDSNPEQLSHIAWEGHEIGNHGYSHKAHSQLSAEGNRLEIQKAHDAVYQVLGMDMSLFAPPSGDFDQTTLSVAQEMGYQTILWSADTIDWRDQDPELLLSRVRNKIDNGGIILTHPTAATAEILGQLIDELRARGYEILPVGEALSR